MLEPSMFDFNPHDQWREYVRTKNPLFVWDMIFDCCQEGRDFPDWVLDYLEDVAREMVSLRPDKKKAASDIRDALGFGGVDKPFKNYEKFWMERKAKQEFEFKWKIYQWITERLGQGVKATQAYMDAGQKFIGEDKKTKNHLSMIRKWYLEMQGAEKESKGN